MDATELVLKKEHSQRSPVRAGKETLLPLRGGYLPWNIFYKHPELFDVVLQTTETLISTGHLHFGSGAGTFDCGLGLSETY